MTACAQCLVRNRAICASLGTTELEALNKLARRQTIQRGQPLIWQGGESVLVANVIEGVLKLSTSTPDGREQIVGLVYPGDFIGRPFGETSAHSVTALTDARLCSFTRSTFDQFARTHPALEHKLLQRTLADLDHARHWMLLIARKSARERVATFLIDMSHRLGQTNCAGPDALDSFALPLDRQQIGDLLGLTIETVSRQITQLRAAGMIDTPDRRTIAIRDRSAMAAIAGL